MMEASKPVKHETWFLHDNKKAIDMTSWTSKYAILDNINLSQKMSQNVY